MAPTLLFRTAHGAPVTTEDLRRALDTVGARECRVLYVHTGLTFGVPNPALGRASLLGELYAALRDLSVPTICLPTYTFSFCNGEDYDSAESRSRMGALNEYIRRQPEAVRSADPLLSVTVVGEDHDLAENLGHESIGSQSTFDKLARRQDVKFLFFGVRAGDCFTYMHYLEWVAGVPYRYDREFTGTIRHAGRTYEDTYRLFVRYNNVKPNSASYAYEDVLADRGLLRVAPLGDHTVRCVGEPGARAVYLELLDQDRNRFIERPFRAADADRTFNARNMVAL